MALSSALVVDDHAETRELLRLLLDGRLSLTFASTPATALDAIDDRMEPFDLLIIDIHLGTERNGTDLLNAIRDRPEYADVPALACTAYAMPGDREELLESGFNTYLSKPFLRDDLFHHIKAALDLDELPRRD